MEVIDNIRKDYKIRKTKKQKKAFIETVRRFSKSKNYESEVKEDSAKLFVSRNIEVGKIEKAEIILTAHYDTCPRSIFPNELAPLNKKKRFFKWLRQIIIIILIAVLSVVIGALVFNNYWIAVLLYFISSTIYIFYKFIGIANRNNENDNTSGVVTLLSIMDKIDNESKDKVAFVFFDNEEKGCFGSKHFKKKYKSIIDSKLLINFDCVSEGDNILLVCTKTAMESSHFLNLKKCFEDNAESYKKKPIFEVSSKARVSSDHKHFDLSIGVIALLKKKKGTLYLSRIHTNRDTEFDKVNIEYLTRCICDFVK